MGHFWLTALFKARFINFGSQDSTLPMPACETMTQHATRALRLSAYVVHSGNYPHHLEKPRTLDFGSARQHATHASVQTQKFSLIDTACLSERRQAASDPRLHGHPVLFSFKMPHQAAPQNPYISANTETSKKAPLARGVWGVGTLNPN